MIWQIRLVFALMKQTFRSAPKDFSKFTLIWSFSGLAERNDSPFPNLSLSHQQVPLKPETPFSTNFSFTYSFDPLAVYPGSVATFFATQGQSETITESTKFFPSSRISIEKHSEEISECTFISPSTSDLPLAQSFAATTNISLSNVGTGFDFEDSIQVINFSEKVMESPEAWRKISVPCKASETVVNSEWQTQKKRHRKRKDNSSKNIKASVNEKCFKNPFSVLMGLEEDLEVEPQNSEAAPAELEAKAGPSSKQSCLSEKVLNQILMRVLAKSPSFFDMENASRNIFSKQTIMNNTEKKLDLTQNILFETLTRRYSEHPTKSQKKEPWRFSTHPYKFRISSSGSNYSFKIKVFSRPSKPPLTEELKARSIKDFAVDPALTCVE